MKRLLKEIVLQIAKRIEVLLNESKALAFRRSLAFCGNNVVFRQPVVIEFPGNVVIEDDAWINAFVHMWGNAGIKIGKRSMIASHVAITSATHDPDSPLMNKSIRMAPVIIENDVWIGAHAVIFPGVTIGEHAVVGAGAIVREDVPAFTVVAGMPARIIRHKETEPKPQEGKLQQ